MPFTSGYRGNTYPDASDPILDMFVAKVTAQTAGTGVWTGFNMFDWIEQVVDPATGAYADASNARLGLASLSSGFGTSATPVNPGFEINGQTPASFPFFAQMRFRMLTGGQASYEFMLPATVALTTSISVQGISDGSTLPTSSSNTTLQSPVSTLRPDINSGFYIGTVSAGVLELRMAQAGTTQSGVMTFGVQTFAGAKTFTPTSGQSSGAVVIISAGFTVNSTTDCSLNCIGSVVAGTGTNPSFVAYDNASAALYSWLGGSLGASQIQFGRTTTITPSTCGIRFWTKDDTGTASTYCDFIGTAFSINGTRGVTGTFQDGLGNTVHVVGGIITSLT